MLSVLASLGVYEFDVSEVESEGMVMRGEARQGKARQAGTPLCIQGKEEMAPHAQTCQSRRTLVLYVRIATSDTAIHSKSKQGSPTRK